MSHITPLPREELAEYEEVFAFLDEVRGFVPRSLYVMGRYPELLNAFTGLAGTVLGPGEVDGELKDLIANVASTAAGCRYCQAHTASSAARSGGSAERIERVWEFESSDLFDDADRAALRLARDAATSPNAATAAHFEELGRHFTERQMVEIMGVISLFGWLNRWNDTLATQLEDEPLGFATSHLDGGDWTPGKHGTA